MSATIDPITQRERQAVFETVAKHLLTQMARSVSTNGEEVACLYRGPNGTKCAIGCLIPDAEYYPYYDDSNMVVSSLFDRAPDYELPTLRAIARDAGERFLRGLQFVHDHNPPEDWYDALQRFAQNYGLQPLPPEMRPLVPND